MHFEHNYHILHPSPREICQKYDQDVILKFQILIQIKKHNKTLKMYPPRSNKSFVYS